MPWNNWIVSFETCWCRLLRNRWINTPNFTFFDDFFFQLVQGNRYYNYFLIVFVLSQVVQEILNVNYFMREFHFNQAKLDEFVLLHQSSHGGFTFRDVIPLHSQRLHYNQSKLKLEFSHPTVVNQFNVKYLDVDFVPRNGFQYFVLGTFDVQTEIVNSSSSHSD